MAIGDKVIRSATKQMKKRSDAHTIDPSVFSYDVEGVVAERRGKKIERSIGKPDHPRCPLPRPC